VIPERVLQVVDLYEKKFQELARNYKDGIPKIDFPHSRFFNVCLPLMADQESLGHCWGMLDQMR